MKSTSEKNIKIWNELNANEKIAFGALYISHDSHLSSFNKTFDELSRQKQNWVLNANFDELNLVYCYGKNLG